MNIRAALLLCSFGLVAGCDSDVDQQVRVIVPADIADIPTGVIRMSLWVYDPLLADAPATLADVDSVRFSHAQGRTQTFHLFVEADVPGHQKHYLSAEGFDLSAQCELRVLWDGLRETASPSVIIMEPVPNAGCVEQGFWRAGARIAVP